jgi:hypothetical protein
MTPHLIHIGFPKTGSTFLQRWFAAHPQIQYREGGIAGFRDVYEMVRRAADPDQDAGCRVTSAEGLATPHAFFGLDAIDHAAIRGDQMPAAQTAACEMLAELFPRAHVLIVTRGFRSMILSGYSQYVRTGGTQDFCAQLDRSGQDDEMIPIRNYDGVIRLYRGAFGDRLIVLPYELLRDDADRFIRLIEDRLGLDHHEPYSRRANEGLSPVELRWYPRIARTLDKLPVGAALRSRIRGRYARAAIANRFRPLIRMLQRIRPLEPVTATAVTDELLERYRGRAEAMRDDPLYAPYKDEYLL